MLCTIQFRKLVLHSQTSTIFDVYVLRAVWVRRTGALHASITIDHPTAAEYDLKIGIAPDPLYHLLIISFLPHLEILRKSGHCVGIRSNAFSNEYCISYIC